MTARAVLLERRRLRRGGFRGRAHTVLFTHRDSRSHSIRVVLYAFGNRRRPTLQPFVELWESHDRARRARIVPLSELVHLVQNVGEMEFWQIAARRRPAAR